MSTRTVHRGSRGRFAGASGGKAEKVRVSRRHIVGQKITAAKNSRLGQTAGRVAKDKRFQAAAATAVIAGGGYVAYNKVNPGTTLRKSGLAIPGTVSTYGGKNSSRPEHTIVKNATHQYTTTSIGKGMKKTQHTLVEKIGPKGAAQPIGYIDSKRAPMGGYRVTHTYLTRANRGKGLGKQALAAHAAHRPNRTYRASMNRSNMGQAFAKSVGGAGVRTGKSKAAGKGITTQLDKAWSSGVRADRVGLAKNTKNKVKGLSPHKIAGKKVRR